MGGVLGAAATAGYLVKPDSPIKSYKDIKGKTLAFASPGGYMHWVAIAAVKAAGLTTQEVKLLPAGGSPEAWAAVQGGAADAAWAIDGGGSQMVIDGKARWAFKDADILPDFQSTAFYTSQKEMTERPDQLKAFLRAYQKSAEYVQANFDEALRLWTAYTSVSQAGITYDKAKQIMDIYPLPLSALTTKLSVAGLKVNGELMLETGVVKEKVDWSKIIDQSFLAPALQVDLSKIQ